MRPCPSRPSSWILRQGKSLRWRHVPLTTPIGFGIIRAIHGRTVRFPLSMNQAQPLSPSLRARRCRRGSSRPIRSLSIPVMSWSPAGAFKTGTTRAMVRSALRTLSRTHLIRDLRRWGFRSAQSGSCTTRASLGLVSAQGSTSRGRSRASSLRRMRCVTQTSQRRPSGRASLSPPCSS